MGAGGADALLIGLAAPDSDRAEPVRLDLHIFPEELDQLGPATHRGVGHDQERLIAQIAQAGPRGGEHASDVLIGQW